MRLTPKVHDRDAAGLIYVYPVVSRRAGGVSVGVNLNTNNACNWRCVYCQVPGLTRGKAPEVDLALLERELEEMLGALFQGDYLARHVAEGQRRVTDVAFSGNGEPTSASAFGAAVELVARVKARIPGAEELPTIVITNGSLVHLPAVQEGLHTLAEGPAQVWFKVDSATEEGQRRLNDVVTGVERTRRNLATCAAIVPTWVQTMVLARGGQPPDEEECARYVAFLQELVAAGVPLRGVLLYGLARRSHQPEAPELAPLPAAWMEAHAERIRATGLEVRLSL